DEPQVYNDGLDYYGNESYAAPDTYEFIHTLSEVVMGIVQAGLVIRGFWEYEEDISNGLGWVQKCGLRLPLSYILLAGKQ
ncbi:MAG: hypothetical protein U1C33_00435, partial [Candidatus Cloacimonadaceae bacterium]|nr:hypothetical protein [Candidatus Cloacimonadaceae bacterium]